MPTYEKAFSFWEKEYIPTARLDSWPKQWFNTNNLRFFGSVTWVAAVPHDIQSRVRLEALHSSIVKREFFDPFVYENRISSDSRKRSVYVSLIPRPVVDWFSKHTLDEIHDQVAAYIALFEIEEKYSNPNVIGDTHSSYHWAIKQHLSTFWQKYPQLDRAHLPLGPHDVFEEENPIVRDYAAFFRRKTEIEEKWRRDNQSEAQTYDEKWDNFGDAETSLLKELYGAKTLPAWFLREIEWKDLNGQTHTYLRLKKLKHDEDFGWQRPTGALADDFGIVSYGLTYSDELRLQGKKIDYDNQVDEEHIVKLTSKELEDARGDSLSRTEADAEAFEFLMYAKSTRKDWPNWSISLPQYTGYIYLYSDGRAIKIGFSSEHPDLEKRKFTLQTGNSAELKLVGYIEGSREKEKILHNRFAHKKTVGEWFDLSSDDITSILSGRY